MYTISTKSYKYTGKKKKKKFFLSQCKIIISYWQSPSGGYLGSCIDDERSKARKVVWRAALWAIKSSNANGASFLKTQGSAPAWALWKNTILIKNIEQGKKGLNSLSYRSLVLGNDIKSLQWSDVMSFLRKRRDNLPYEIETSLFPSKEA